MKKKKFWVSLLAGILALLLVLGLLSGLAPIFAEAKTVSQMQDEKSQLEKEKEALKQQEEKIQQELEELGQQFSENYSEMEKIVAEKNLIDQEIGLLSQQIFVVNQQITNFSNLIADKQEELDAAKAHLEELNEKNKERIRAMEENGNLSYWSVLFKANSFADLLDRLNMIEEIAAADQRRLQEMSDAAEAVELARQELEAEKESLEASKTELDVMQIALEEKRVVADGLLAELVARDEELKVLMEEAEDADEELIKEIAAKEKEINQLNEDIEEANRPVVDPGTGNTQVPEVDGGWIVPCSYTYLSSPYGWRVHPVHGDWRFHSGVDLAAPRGTPIYASRAGTVTTATYSGSAGYYVTINHGDGFSTSYLHMMTHANVKAGDTVTAGQVIGYVGSTGTSTGNHLHFTVYYNGSTINPATVISKFN